MLTHKEMKFSKLSIDVTITENCDETEVDITIYSKGVVIARAVRRWETDMSMMKHQGFYKYQGVPKRHLIYARCLLKALEENDTIDYWYNMLDKIYKAKTLRQFSALI